ncbi:MAG: ATP-binding cassette domain-containing protein [Candidatus Aminicenantes bacterium]|nr:ATP-binding cassette domain-containing protein [Candidatus Aminicenantes bacterium]NIM84674.1 ATP-binding cassette domain-containing protein [Candidatus Aminicenantes bacterium]NIN24173.1 ATP-binding cassette domain-containing protein [Candidatus Aminicenantes bacterium]NIN47898.1 ATP-binding cassette domain-containing protein [Candidatus Aminicenantes bacterium]NIN90836.1 ATP-binding cassette domain-containing protein [Candidatus Aminicenantes bacterium]
MGNLILDIKNITKSYGDITALNNFSLSLQKGEVIGLLGPNGAGKTTLISILSGTVKDFSGSVTFKGKNLFSHRTLKNHMGIVPQDMAFYEDLNAIDNLMFWGGLYEIPRSNLKQRAWELLELVELSARAKDPIKKYSGGMKRRLNVAIGLIHKPGLLLLDEPTVGIDVQAKVNILDIIKNVGHQGTSVIFTTHQLAEVEEICSRIAIMDKGAILAQGTLEELIRIVGEKEIVDVQGEFSANQFSEALKAPGDGIEILSVSDNLANLAFANTDKIPAMMERLFKNNIQVSDLKIKSPNLEAVFLKLTGRSLRD